MKAHEKESQSTEVSVSTSEDCALALAPAEILSMPVFTYEPMRPPC